MTNWKQWLGVCLVLFGMVAPAVSSAEEPSTEAEVSEALISVANCETNCNEHCERCTDPCQPLGSCEMCATNPACLAACSAERSADCARRGLPH